LRGSINIHRTINLLTQGLILNHVITKTIGTILTTRILPEERSKPRIRDIMG
jgi:hypothetical protein